MKLLHKFCVLALASTLTMTSGAMAQDDTTTNSEEFPTGTEPVVQPGQTYAREVFGDWELLCIKTPEGPEPCEIGQLILDANATPVSDVRIFPLPQGSAAIAGANFITPLGVLLQSGLVFGIDDKEVKQYPYQFCNNIGCIARVGFTPLELQAMRKGEVGKMTFRMANAPDKPANIELSLKGFAAAFAALSKLQLEQSQ
ncbi:MAG: invasion protein IalB [Paracoccaceae bacterium]|jgi:invasion protein IalB